MPVDMIAFFFALFAGMASLFSVDISDDESEDQAPEEAPDQTQQPDSVDNGILDNIVTDEQTASDIDVGEDLDPISM